MARIEYRKEFFDRTYTAREAYSRLWKYARRYRFRIVCGIVLGRQARFRRRAGD